MNKKKQVRWLATSSRRNSDCAKNLKTLDWDNWWLDTSHQYCHLHVRSEDDGGDTWWRVYCKHTDNPRVGVRDGVLYWLIDGS